MKKQSNLRNRFVYWIKNHGGLQVRFYETDALPEVIEVSPDEPAEAKHDH